jgi:DNA-binding MarR family transcriptional regulator
VGEHETIVDLLRRSPLLFRILRTIAESTEPINPRRLSAQLKRAEPTIHLALKELLENGLVQSKPGADRRVHIYSIPAAKLQIVRLAIQKVKETSTPLAMAELGRIIQVELKEMDRRAVILDGVQWRNSTHGRLTPTPDLVLELNGVRVVIELMLGMHHFSRRLFETAGWLLAFNNLEVELIVLCVFGHVPGEIKRHFKELVRPIFAGRLNLLLIFVEEEPSRILSTDEGSKIIRNKVILPIIRKLGQTIGRETTGITRPQKARASDNTRV